MDKALIYLFKGLAHYFYLIFELIDFKDIIIMLIILTGICYCAITTRNVMQSLKKAIFASIKALKTIPGIIFLSFFIFLYGYTLIFFEEKINIILVLFSIYLLFQELYKVADKILVEKDISIIIASKEIILLIFLIAFQQITSIIETNNYSNLQNVLYFLMFIPVYIINVLLMKYYTAFTDFLVFGRRCIKISKKEIFHIFNICLLYSKSYKITYQIMLEFLHKNKNMSYIEMKKEIKGFTKKSLPQYKIIKNKKKNSEKSQSNLYRKFNYIWIMNIMAISFEVIDFRFFNTNFSVLYYMCYLNLLIYFWYDLMKIKKIENQIDFVIYMLFYIIFIIILLIYNCTLKVFRLSEIAFLLPIFIFIRHKTHWNNFPNFTKLPYLSKNNFFKLDPKKYTNNQ